MPSCQKEGSKVLRYSRMENTYRSPASLTTLELLDLYDVHNFTDVLSCKFNVALFYLRFIPMVIVFDVERTKFLYSKVYSKVTVQVYPACRSKNISASSYLTFKIHRRTIILTYISANKILRYENVVNCK